MLRDIQAKRGKDLPGKTLVSHFLAKQQKYRSRSGLSVHMQAGLSELHLLVKSGKKQPFCSRGTR